MGYGIGRVPADVDEADEALAELAAQSIRPAPRQFVPTGTTPGVRTPGKRCQQCPQPGDWNPGAGRHLCARHWDSY